MDKTYDLVVLVVENRGTKSQVRERIRLRLPAWRLQTATSILALIGDWCAQARRDLSHDASAARRGPGPQ
jgi:hypothetical protein